MDKLEFFLGGGNKKIKPKIFTESLSLNSIGDGGNKANSRAVVLPGFCHGKGCSRYYPDLSAGSEGEAGLRAGRASVLGWSFLSPLEDDQCCSPTASLRDNT